MPITSVSSDPEALTITVVGEYPVPVARLWDAWVDPRQIEQFWGPPGWPARFLRHDMVVGGRSHYEMTSPDGQTSAGYWVVRAIEHGRWFEVVDGFAGDDGEANETLPSMTMRYDFEATEHGSRFVGVTTFPDLAAMEQLVEMGMLDGVREAFAAMDDVLADLAAFAVDRVTQVQVLDDLRFRTSRIVRGTAEQVWRAHHDADLLRRWLLGPDGWTMPVCVAAQQTGDSFRWEWESEDGTARFGLEGELVDAAPPHRSVTTERPIDTDGAGTLNEMTLTPVEGGTLVSIVVTCPSIEVRDEILGTEMAVGMEASYARLDEVVGVATP